MNIPLQKMISSGTVQQQNPRTDTNPLYNVSFDKVTFDSFMNNFKAEPVGKVQEQSELRPAGNEEQYANRKDEISRKEETAEHYNKIDDQKCENMPDENRSRIEGADRPAETDDNGYSQGSGEISGNRDQTDQYAETEDQVSGSGTVVTDNGPEQLDDADTDSNEGEANRVNSLNTAALLFAMANNHAGTLNGTRAFMRSPLNQVSRSLLHREIQVQAQYCQTHLN